LPDPDYAGLTDSGEFRFRSIDSKLSIALQNMVDSAGETASEAKVRIRQRSQVLGKEGNFLMGREILAMVLDHFRTTSKDEVLFNASHIYKLQYRGDKEMDKFLHAWIEIIANMKAEDIPSDNTLRDHLLRKIDGSQALHVDLTIFKGRDNDDKKKSYNELLEIMKRHITRAREDRNIAARDKFATDYINLGKPSTPAPKPTAPTPTPKDGKPGKPSAPAPKGKPGAPVLPSGNPKSHGKGKGKGGKRSRSPSTRDPPKTFCHFHFNKGNCKHGDKCQYSHSQYHWDKRKDKGGKGKNSRSATPRRLQTPGGKKDRHCYGSPSAKMIQKMMKFMLTKSLERMKIKKMMTIEYQQLTMLQKLINPMKMKLVLNMDHLKKKMMRMISMLMIPMEEYVYRREAR